ncbi:biotin-dependent carboxyltransferase family protein [Paenibacillus sp. KQZ6P-2]|uniref:Biotin-dependent carboxyltransferase family protein n=1 Tax=Paenibacillus mangrovi TaxID=2931978 RepID=A0A9X2B4R8_9BACL|nr:biotin-dependent carboxyltransferase family protein [Paenibacillus mangrovi]MCJ8014924.1 biotin-dependent carboxyltransferase family protein [Paenibacillus mangrovi]
MSLEVLKRGLLATVQDIGRRGYGKFGVGTSGVMDSYAYSLANWLVGNNGEEAALEITWYGFAVKFLSDTLVSITGADLAPESGGLSVPMWRPVFFRQGSELIFKRPVSGCRSYVAVSGGIDVPEVMGSRSTNLRAGIGGLNGRALESGDVIHIQHSASSYIRLSDRSENSPFQTVKWSAAPHMTYGGSQVIRVTRGRQFEDFHQEARDRFFQSEYSVKPESDRMGYRLSGPVLGMECPREYISEGVAAGTVQVPADGQPIVLMADRQTLGGYPKIAQVASVDLPRVAQLPPGGRVRFQEISHSESEQLCFEQARQMRLLKTMIDSKLKEENNAAD